MTVRVEDLRGDAADAFRMWRDTFGLSEQAALNAVVQDGLVDTGGFDRTVSAFRNIFGLSESAGVTAVVGRGSVSEARRGWDSSGGSSSSGDVFVRAQEALAEMSDAECDQMLVEERRRKSSKKSASGRSGGSGKPYPTVVSERNWRK